MLTQSVNALLVREKNIINESEFLVFSQDKVVVHIAPGNNIELINLNMPVFNKSKIVNESVRRASSNKIIMLDGDRILPVGYFTEQLNKINRREIVTTRYMVKHTTVCDTSDLESSPYREDHRDQSLTPGKKNLFSGNTTMYKDDFWELRGMDESFENYGCADLDFATRAVQSGMTCVFTDHTEHHLWHPLDMSQEAFEYYNVRSVLKYCRKWNKPVPKFFIGLMKKYYI
jgi:predicted glycosyltransferase involved in capsule biosynthesis